MKFFEICNLKVATKTLALYFFKYSLYHVLSNKEKKSMVACVIFEKKKYKNQKE